MSTMSDVAPRRLGNSCFNLGGYAKQGRYVVSIFASGIVERKGQMRLGVIMCCVPTLHFRHGDAGHYGRSDDVALKKTQQ